MISLLFSFALVCPSPGSPPPSAPSLCCVPQDELARRIQDACSSALEIGADGLAVAISLGNERYLARGFGQMADAAAEADSPCAGGALMGVFLAAQTLELAQAGRLDLDESLATRFEGLDPGITARHLLTHTSGLPSIGEHLDRNRPTTREAALEWLVELGTDAQPGTCSVFSDTNEWILGWLIEDLCGKSVTEALKENLFDPAGLDATRFADEAVVALEATARRDFGGSETPFRARVDAPFGASGLETTALDLLRWQRALANRDPFQVYDEMIEPVRLTGGHATGRGIAVDLARLGDREAIGYGGALGRTRIRVSHYPEAELIIVLVAEGELAPLDETERRIARAFLGLPEPTITDVELPQAEQEAYLGAYNVGCTTYNVLGGEGHIVLQHPIRGALALRYQGAQRFVLRDDPSTELTFLRGARQTIAFDLTENGVTVRAKRIQ